MKILIVSSMMSSVQTMKMFYDQYLWRLNHTMLLMLQYLSYMCLNIAPCGMFSYSSSVGWMLDKSILQSFTLEHALFLWVENMLLTKECEGERGRLKLRRSSKDGRLFNLNVFFSYLPLLCIFQAQCDGREEKQIILALRAWIRYYTGHHFSIPSK